MLRLDSKSREANLKTGGKRVREKFLLILKVAFIVVLPCGLTLLYSGWFSGVNEPQSAGGLGVDMSRAAIIDGIGVTKPNPEFMGGVKEVLERAGLKVDVYEGENVTIDLLRNIGGYGILILRVHSAIDLKYGFLYLFSAEEFNETEYDVRFSEEKRLGAVREGVTFENERYFALRADLLGYLRPNGLKGSTIILMGCNGTGSEHTLNRLFEKGVKAIIAWNGYVSLEYTDEITLNLIRAAYEKSLKFPEAVKKIMEEYGPDPVYESKLEYIGEPSSQQP